MDEGVDSRRVGLLSKGAPARQHSKILNEDGEEVIVTSPPIPRHEDLVASEGQNQSINPTLLS